MPLPFLGWARGLNKYQKAKLYVVNGLHGRPVALDDPASLAAQAVYHSRWYRVLYSIMTVLYMAMAMVEPPIDAKDHRKAWMVVVEVIALLLVCGDLYLQYTCFGPNQFWRKKWIVTKLIVVVLLVVNLVMASLSSKILGVMRGLRPIIFIERHRNVRRIASNILQTFPRVSNVVIISAVHVMFFGVLGFVFFAGIDADSCSVTRGTKRSCSTFLLPPRGCDDYFSTLSDSMMQLFILTTTANYPDIMMPVYRCSRFSALFFVVFIVIGAYFLLILTLAVTTTEFDKLTRAKVLNKYGAMMRGVDAAFRKLVFNDRNRLSVKFERSVSRRLLRSPPRTQSSLSSFGTGLSSPRLQAATATPPLPVGHGPPRQPRRATAAAAPPSTGRRSLFPASSSRLFSTPGGGGVGGGGGGGAAAAAGRGAGNGLGPAGAHHDASDDGLLHTIGLSLTDWLEFMVVMRPDMPQDLARRLFRVWDTDRRDEVYLPEFRRMMLHFSRVKIDAVASEWVQVEDSRIRKPAPPVTSAAASAAPTSASTSTPAPVSPPATTNLEHDPIMAGIEAGLAAQESKAGVEPRPPAPVSAPVMRRVIQRPGHPVRPWPPRGSMQCPTRGELAYVLDSVVATSFFNLAVLLNGVFVIVELVLDTDIESEKPEDTLRRVSIGQYITLGVFVIEVLLKLVVFTPGVYVRRNGFNKLDVILVFSAVIGIVLESLGHLDSTIRSAVTFFRMLRLFRLFRILPSFAVIVKSFWEIVPVLGQYMAVLLSFYYSFAIVGMELFANRLVQTDPAVAASSYGVLHYWPYNFDSLANTFVVLFYLMVGNNWPIIMEGCTAATSTTARLYFVTFYGVTVVLVLNVLVSFILESFAAKRIWNEARAREKREEKALAKREALRNGGIPNRCRWWACDHRTAIDDDDEEDGYGVDDMHGGGGGGHEMVSPDDPPPATFWGRVMACWWTHPLPEKTVTPVEDWRQVILDSPEADLFDSWHLMKPTHHWDVYEQLYSDDIRAKFKETFEFQRRVLHRGSVADPEPVRRRGPRGMARDI